MRFFQAQWAIFLSLLMACLVAVTGCSDGSGQVLTGSQMETVQLSFKAKASGQWVRFTLSDEVDLGQVLWWRWNFGDGEISSDRSPVHRYSDPGIYSVTLEWQDLTMRSGFKSDSIEVAAFDAVDLDWELVLGQQDLTHASLAGGPPGFVMVGAMGALLFSENGFDWTEVATHVGVDFVGVIWTNEAFWAFGSSEFYTSGPNPEFYSVLLKSTQGTDWTVERIPGIPATGFASNGQTHVLAGRVASDNGDPRRPSTTAVVRVSIEGGPWQEVSVGGSGVRSVIWTGTLFVVFGYVDFSVFSNPSFFTKTSVDGIHWELHEDSIDRLLFPIATNGKAFVRAGLHGMEYSEDGLNWRETPFQVPEPMRDVVWGDDRFVALSENYTLMSGDGQAWEPHTLPEKLEANTRLAFSSGIWLIHNLSGPVLWSGNGIEWFPNPESEAPPPTRNWTAAAAWEDGFVIGAKDGTVATSRGGRHWQEEGVQPDFQIQILKVVKGEIWASGLIASNGVGAVFRRTPSNWVQVLSTQQPLVDFTEFGEKVFLVDRNKLFTLDLEIPNSGLMAVEHPDIREIKQLHATSDTLTILTSRHILLSQDGVSWQPFEHPLEEARVMCQWKGFWYVAGQENSVWDWATVWFRSSNLKDWEPVAFDFANHITHLVAGESKMVATGRFSNGIKGRSRGNPFDRVYSSSDGLVWQPETSSPAMAPASLAFNQNKFLAVGKGFVWLQQEE